MQKNLKTGLSSGTELDCTRESATSAVLPAFVEEGEAVQHSTIMMVRASHTIRFFAVQSKHPPYDYILLLFTVYPSPGLVSAADAAAAAV